MIKKDGELFIVKGWCLEGSIVQLRGRGIPTAQAL